MHLKAIRVKEELLGAEDYEVLHALIHTICPRSSDPFYIVTYDIKWVTISWTNGSNVYFLTFI